MNSAARWSGYARDDGPPGIRNLTLVLYTVECASHVASRIAEGEEDTHVVGFPGCYGNQYALDLMLAIARHPNVGSCLAVGLGCEYLHPGKISEVVAKSGRPSRWLYIQESGGTHKSILRGKEMLRELRRESAEGARRVPMGWEELMIGTECGGSDATSGLAANPVVGRAFDIAGRRGATLVWEELVEMIGLEDQLAARAADSRVEEEIRTACRKSETYCAAVRQYSVSPGNFTGGLTTIEEKSLGSYAKSGTRPIEGVLKVSGRPAKPGLWLLDTVPDPFFMQFGYTNPNDTEGLMDLISVGCHLLLYTTGRGSCTGSPVAPTVKVTGNPETYARLEGDMDFNAGRVLTGEASLDEAAGQLLDQLQEYAAGRATKSEALGHREQYVMFKYQDRAAGRRCDGC